MSKTITIPKETLEKIMKKIEFIEMRINKLDGLTNQEPKG